MPQSIIQMSMQESIINKPNLIAGINKPNSIAQVNKPNVITGVSKPNLIAWANKPNVTERELTTSRHTCTCHCCQSSALQAPWYHLLRQLSQWRQPVPDWCCPQWTPPGVQPAQQYCRGRSLVKGTQITNDNLAYTTSSMVNKLYSTLLHSFSCIGYMVLAPCFIWAISTQ